MNNHDDIRDKLARLEALFARGATAGERAAAEAALGRMQARLDFAERKVAEQEVELQYILPDTWAVRVFVALCRKHGVKPYRYPRQRRTTVMVRASQREFERTIAAEFRKLHGELTRYFDEMVNHLIADAMKSDGSDDGLELRQIGS